MRRFFSLLKAITIVLLASVCAGFALILSSLPVFDGGEGYELYLGENSSSPVLSTDSPTLDKLACTVVGESARYDGDRYEELKERFRAKLLFLEEMDGATHYYLYSPLLGAGTQVRGYTVNLHVAVRQNRTTVGTPLIFGGV